MFIRAALGGQFGTVGYLVYDRKGGTGAIIDAPLASTKKYLTAIHEAQVQILYIINTHGHWEQTADNATLVKQTGAALCVHVWDTTRLAHPELTVEDKLPFPLVPSVADRYLHDEEIIEVGSIKFEVLHTPGHTPGSVCLYSSEDHVLFSGDLLLRNGVGREDLPGGNLGQIESSLRRLSTLPNSTQVYPAHGLSTSIREERWLLDLALMDAEAHGT